MTHNIIDAQVATASINSEAFDMDGQKSGLNMSFTANTTGFNQADATVKIQHSNDKTNWTDVTDGSITIASGTASQTLTPITNLGVRYYRIVYTKNTNSAGTITVILNVQ